MRPIKENERKKKRRKGKVQYVLERKDEGEDTNTWTWKEVFRNRCPQ